MVQDHGQFLVEDLDGPPWSVFRWAADMMHDSDRLLAFIDQWR